MRQIEVRRAEAIRGFQRLLAAGCTALAAALLIAGCATPRNETTPQDVASRILKDGCPGGSGPTERIVPNPHVPGLQDRIRTLHCNGMTAEIYLSSAASDPNGLPLTLDVTRPDARIPADYDVGSTPASVVARLGPPTERTPDALRYAMDDAQASVTFAIRDGRVAAIHWDWYVD